MIHKILITYTPNYFSVGVARYFSIGKVMRDNSQFTNISNDLSSKFVSRLLNSFNDPNNVLINNE